MPHEVIIAARLVISEREPNGALVQVFEAVNYRGISIVCRGQGEAWDQSYRFNGEMRPDLSSALASWRERQRGLQ